jgi:hypothetical protein
MSDSPQASEAKKRPYKKPELKRLGKERPEGWTKRPYKKPALIRLGTLREITMNVGVTGKQDGGGTGKTKTSP